MRLGVLAVAAISLLLNACAGRAGTTAGKLPFSMQGQRIHLTASKLIVDPDASEPIAAEIAHENGRIVGLLRTQLADRGFVVVRRAQDDHDLVLSTTSEYSNYRSPLRATASLTLNVSANDGKQLDSFDVYVSRDSTIYRDVTTTLVSKAVQALAESEPVLIHAVRNPAPKRPARDEQEQVLATQDGRNVRLMIGEPTGLANPQDADLKRIAIPMLTGDGLSSGQRSVLSDLLLTQAAGFPELNVISPAEVNAVLDLERQKDLLGCDQDLACVADIAGALGVDGILLAAIGQFGDTNVLTLKLVDVRNVRVVLRSTSKADASSESLVPLVERAVPALLNRLVGR